jgi:nicotinate-nucleotide adenylyltransferase
VRVGVFGGTFDPPHVGHLLVSTDAMERLALDRLVLVPAATQPLKAGDISATADARLAMTRLLVGDDPRFEVDPIEIERGGLSYMVDTLEALAERWPGAELYLLAGADVLGTFHRWRDPERVRSLATLAVLTRDGAAVGAASTAGPPIGPPIGAPNGLPGGPPVFVPSRRVDVSSTEIRARLRAGKSIRGFVPEAVADFIRSAGLYR